MRAELLPELAVRPLVEQMEIDLADGREEAVRVAPLPRGPAAEVKAQPVAKWQRQLGKEAAEQPVLAAGECGTASVGKGRLHGDGIGMERADHHAIHPAHCRGVEAENAVRLVVLAVHQTRALERIHRRRRLAEQLASLGTRGASSGGAIVACGHAQPPVIASGCVCRWCARAGRANTVPA